MNGATSGPTRRTVGTLAGAAIGAALTAWVASPVLCLARHGTVLQRTRAAWRLEGAHPASRTPADLPAPVTEVTIPAARRPYDAPAHPHAV